MTISYTPTTTHPLAPADRVLVAIRARPGITPAGISGYSDLPISEVWALVRHLMATGRIDRMGEGYQAKG